MSQTRKPATPEYFAQLAAYLGLKTLAATARPDIVYLKSLYRFARDEG